MNLRSMLRQAGLGEDKVNLAIIGMFWRPVTSRPNSANTMAIVKGIQNLLGVKPSGVIDKPTANRLAQVCGPNWGNKAWEEIYKAVLGGSMFNRVGGSSISVHGLGSVDPSNFAITHRGSAKPLNYNTRILFKEIQKQANRLAVKSGKFGVIGVDGIIGKNTVAAVQMAAIVSTGVATFGVLNNFILKAYANPQAIAEKADLIGPALKSAADMLGAPTSVAGSILPSRAGGGDKAVTVDEETGALKTTSDPTSFLFGWQGMALLGVGIGVAYAKFSKKKGRRR